MLYTIRDIVRRRLEQEQNPERRETLTDMLDMLESKETQEKPPLEPISRVRHQSRCAKSSGFRLL